MSEQSVYILVWTDIAPAEEDAFNRWYDEEHLRDRLTVPGIVEVSRFAALEGQPKYIAFYEAAGRGVLSSAPYMALRAKPDERSVYFIQRFANTIRSMVRTGGDTGASSGAYAAFFAIAGERQWTEDAEFQKVVAATPAGARLRILPTDRDLLAEQSRGLAQSARSKLRPNDRVPDCVIVSTTDNPDLAHGEAARLLTALEKRTTILGHGVFRRTISLKPGGEMISAGR